MIAPPSTREPDAAHAARLATFCGLGMLGLVWTSVLAFALPAQAIVNPAAFGGEGAIDRFAWVAEFVFVDGTFHALVAMVFGAACLACIECDRGRARPHLARMAVLFAMGLVGALLWTDADILRALAVAGLALPLLVPLSSRALCAVGIGLVAVHLGGGIVVFGAAVLDFYVGRTGSDAALFAERVYGASEPALRAALEQGREGLGERLERRFGDFAIDFRGMIISAPINLAAMAVGMALWKDGMWQGTWRTFRLQRLAAIAALVALPALFWLTGWVSQNGFPGALAGAARIVLAAPFDLMLALAYAALAMALFAPGTAANRVLEAIGRMPLTNYFAISLILSAIFAQWGLGLFARLSRAEACLLAIALAATMAVWSPYYTARFGRGPVERLWLALVRILS